MFGVRQMVHIIVVLVLVEVVVVRVLFWPCEEVRWVSGRILVGASESRVLSVDFTGLSRREYLQAKRSHSSTDMDSRFGRFPVYGTKSGISGQDFIYSNNGPMSRSLESLKLYCRAVLSDEVSPWTLDPKCLPIPWREDVITPKGGKLRFGIISDNDGEYSIHPPIVRGLAMTRKALEVAGHEVFEWAPTDHPAIVQEMNSSFHTLGAAAIVDLTLQNEEPVYGSMKDYEETYKKGEYGTLGPTKLREMITRRNAVQKAYLDRWNETAKDGQVMDGIICPASVWTAPRLGISQTLFCVNFTGVFNVLGMFKTPMIEEANMEQIIQLARFP